MTVIKTVSAYEGDVTQQITSLANVAVHPGSLIHDTVISPSALNIYTISYINEYVSRLQSLDSTLALLSDNAFITELAIILGKTNTDVLNDISNHIDRTGNNYLLTRNLATQSTGVVYIGGNASQTGTINAGSTVVGSSGVVYKTASSVSGSLSYDTDLQLYVIPVTVTSQTTGSATNAAPYTITKLGTLSTTFTNLAFVTNKVATSGGTDKESDSDFILRIKSKFLGINLATVNGLSSLVLNNFTTIGDAYAVSAGDPEMIRDGGFGGAADVYIQLRNLTQATATINYTGGLITPLSSAYYGEAYGIKKPIDIIGFVPPPGTVGTLFKDNTSVYIGSVKSQDYIYWSTPPATLGSYPITYFYNSNVYEVQTFLDQENNKMLGASILAKEAGEVLADIQFTITVSGRDKTSTIADVKTAISSYIGAFKLGQELDQSKLIALIESVNGVDRVILPMTLFNVNGLSGAVDRITALNSQFIILNVLNIS